MIEYCGDIYCLARAGFHCRDNPFSQALVCDPDYRRHAHAGRLDQDPFHFGGIDVGTTADDHFIFAAY
jgi:hypothetical protein